MTSHTTRSIAIAVCVLGCGDVPRYRTTITLDRPGAVGFTCLRVADGSVAGLPISACDPDLDLCGADQDPAVDGCRDGRARLHALVLQTTRGELAVVDLQEDEILDVDDVVPGFSSHAVGALPVALAVSSDGRRVYVASRWDRRVDVILAENLREFTGAAPETIPLGAARSEPADMVMDGLGRLVVALPEEGAITILSPDDGSEIACIALGAPTEEKGPCAGWLAGADAGPGDAGPGDAGPGDGGPVDAGPADAGPPDAGPDGPTEDDLATPVQIALVGSDGRSAWVADPGTRFVWHVDLATPGILDAIDVGVTTSSVSVEPTLAPRFLYVVDAEGGEVRVVDLESRTIVDPNLAPFDPLAEGTGLRVPGLARTVTLVERNDALEDGEEASPFHLNGVFAFVASTNGGVYVVDVEDRDVAAGARPLEDEADRFLSAPHHLRSAFVLREDGAPRLARAPELVRDGGSQNTSCELVCSQPHFSGACGPSYCNSPQPDPLAADPAEFGIELAWQWGEPGVDTLWRSTNERWDVVFEGPLPGTNRTRGIVRQDENVLEDARTNLCRLGVEVGDRLELLSSPLGGEECGDCSAFELDDEGRSLVCEIAEVGPRALRVGRCLVEGALREEEGWPPGTGCCHPEFTRYQVRVRTGEWVVVGAQTGYLHPWAAEGESCVESPALSEDPDLREVQRRLRVGRATRGDEFANPYLAFTIEDGTDPSFGEPRTDDSYSFTTTGAFAPIVLSGGGLVTQVVRAPVGESIFVVDSSRGLLEFSLRDLGLLHEFR